VVRVSPHAPPPGTAKRIAKAEGSGEVRGAKRAPQTLAPQGLAWGGQLAGHTLASPSG